jgi:hypothetical protein
LPETTPPGIAAIRVGGSKRCGDVHHLEIAGLLAGFDPFEHPFDANPLHFQIFCLPVHRPNQFFDRIIESLL